MKKCPHCDDGFVPVAARVVKEEGGMTIIQDPEFTREMCASCGGLSWLEPFEKGDQIDNHVFNGIFWEEK